jgi:hypothetical protein
MHPGLVVFNGWVLQVVCSRWYPVAGMDVSPITGAQPPLLYWTSYVLQSSHLEAKLCVERVLRLAHLQNFATLKETCMIGACSYQ